jgi:hypothetical protein
VIFHYRLKERGYKRVHTKLVATYRRNVSIEDSLKCEIRKHHSGRRCPTGLSKTDRPPFDIAETISTGLNKRSFSSTEHIATQFQTSRERVKKLSLKS